MKGPVAAFTQERWAYKLHRGLLKEKKYIADLIFYKRDPKKIVQNAIGSSSTGGVD
jgi:hypothetical protein